MSIYHLRGQEAPWGDYGDILLHGMSEWHEMLSKTSTQGTQPSARKQSIIGDCADSRMPSGRGPRRNDAEAPVQLAQELAARRCDEHGVLHLQAGEA